MLVLVNGGQNSNKFYELTLEGNIVTARYGRVGSQGTTVTYKEGERKFNSLMRSKKNKGYREVDVVTDDKPQHGTAQVREAAKKSLTRGTSQHPDITALIERLVDVNRHEILETSGGNIKIADSGRITTPVGVISKNSLRKASVILDNIAPRNVPVTILEEYLTLIPQKVNPHRGWHKDWFQTPESVQQQKDFVKQLSDSLSWYEANQNSSEDENDYTDLFRYTLDIVEDPRIFNKIKRTYERTSSNIHRASTLKLKNVYAIADVAQHHKFAERAKEIGNVKELWHGTRAFNVLSVLRKGLFIPPFNGSIMTTGRMFGDGIYFSDQSTKALNYAYGYAPGMQRTHMTSSSYFMFFSDVAMGWEFQPNRQGHSAFTQQALHQAHNGKDANGQPFNSISIKGGTMGVLNNEMIVWNTDQISLKYLCEFTA